WLLWSAVFFHYGSIENTIAPFIFAASILFSKILPWHRLILPKDDVLGRRMMLVTSVVGLAILIFLGTQLILIDRALIPELDNLIRAREATLMVFILVSGVLYYQVVAVI